MTQALSRFCIIAALALSSSSLHAGAQAVTGAGDVPSIVFEKYVLKNGLEVILSGSKHVANDTHFKILEAAGASLINGTTDFDRTNYFETVPSHRIELAQWIESDRMGYLLDKVDRTPFANQQDVFRNERRQSVENQPYAIAEEALINSCFRSRIPTTALSSAPTPTSRPRSWTT